MKRVLFILSATSTGGTSSSLGSLYANRPSEEWEVRVFVMQHNEPHPVAYRPAMLPKERLTSAFYCFFSRQPVGEKPYVFAVKVMRRLSARLGFDLEGRVLRRTAQRLSASGPWDVVADYSGTGFETTRLAAMVDGRRHVAWNHGFGQTDAEEQRKLECYRPFDAILCVSESTTAKFNRLFPALSSRTHTVPNMLDNDAILSKGRQNPDDERFRCDKFTLVSVGRISAVKRFSHIPAMAAALKAQGCDFRWYIVGPVYEADEASRLAMAVADHGVQSEVVWLGGKENPYPYIRHADLLACTSLSESGPLVVREAQLLGTPSICCDFPSAFEQIADGENGIIAPLEQFPARLAELIRQPEACRQLKAHTADHPIDNTAIIKTIDQLFTP